jgi:hypothetical protein
MRVRSVLAVALLACLLLPGLCSAQTGDVPATSETAPPPPGPPKPLLYGVILGARGWTAYIEDPATKTVGSYQIGDTVAGQTIEVIEEERVVLKGPEGMREIHLSDEKPGAPRRPR